MKVTIFYLFLGFLVLLRFKKKTQCSLEKENDLRFIEVSEYIDRLNELKNKIETIERMITDIELCEPDQRATAFNISMPGSSASYDLLINNDHEKILELLKSERKKLRSSLQKELSEMQYRCNGNVTETIAKRA